MITFTYRDGKKRTVNRSKVKNIKFVEEDTEAPIFKVNEVPFTMIKVEKGTFTMGATSEQGSWRDDEKPTHKVTLTKDYYLGQTEVTQKLWKAIMGSDNNPSYFKGDSLPVESMSYDAITGTDGFIAKLNKKVAEIYQETGKTYTFRLPTEAEWEFAARGGNKTQGYTYSGSNNLDEVAWYSSNSNRTTHAVAMKKPNELDLYDMTGNVFDWCSDWYGSYSSDDQTDPTGPSSGSWHVARGGAWLWNQNALNISYRLDSTASAATYRYDHLGMRLALSIE